MIPPRPQKEAFLTAFQSTARDLPYYRDILKRNRVDPSTIVTYADFTTRVPILKKEDIFSSFEIDELCRGGIVPVFKSAIVSSGTSGAFSFSLVTKEDEMMQERMLDTFLGQFFGHTKKQIIIVNALPMGVSFSSSHPVIQTSSRADIAFEVIRTLARPEMQIVIITDPRVLKHILEIGKENGYSWGKEHISAVIGGRDYSEKFATYLRTLLQEEGAFPHNQLFGTFGVTEVGLNIFMSTPELMDLRSLFATRADLREEILGSRAKESAPQLMSQVRDDIGVEIVNDDEDGIGTLLFTHLSPHALTPLVRYNAGDMAKWVDKEKVERLTGLQMRSPYPLVAFYGRDTQVSGGADIRAIEDALYSDSEIASRLTGNFLVERNKAGESIVIQLKRGENAPEFSTIGVREVTWCAYEAFSQDMELSYDRKWKHFSSNS